MQSLLSRIVDRAGGLIFTIIVARLLAPELFGAYSLALAVMLIVLTFADFGLGQTSIRFIADALGQKNKKLARSYFKFLFKYKFFITLGFVLLLIIFAKAIAIFLFGKPEITLPLQAAAVYLFFVSTLDFISYTFFAAKKAQFYTVREIVFQITRIATVPFLIIFLAVEYKIVGVFLALAIAAILALIVSFFNMRRISAFLLKGPVVKVERKRILRFAFLLMIGILPGVFFTYIDSLMLGAMLPIEYVGFYRAAYTIVASVGGLLMFYLAILPFFTQLKGERFRKVFKKLFHFTAIVAIPAAFGVALISKPFIKILFGAEYLPAIFPLYILSLLILDFALFTYFTSAFQAKEKPEVPTKFVIIAAILNVILNFFLIKTFAAIRIDLGMIGAALATITSRYFYGFAISISAAKQLKLKPDFASIYKPFLASIGMSIFLIVMLMLFYPTNIFIGLLHILLAAIVYGILLFLIRGITMKDILYIKKAILR